MKISQLICENVTLWLEWNKLHAIGVNITLPIDTRAKAYQESEKIIEQINKNINEFDFCIK